MTNVFMYSDTRDGRHLGTQEIVNIPINKTDPNPVNLWRLSWNLQYPKIYQLLYIHSDFPGGTISMRSSNMEPRITLKGAPLNIIEFEKCIVEKLPPEFTLNDQIPTNRALRPGDVLEPFIICKVKCFNHTFVLKVIPDVPRPRTTEYEVPGEMYVNVQIVKVTDLQPMRRALRLANTLLRMDEESRERANRPGGLGFHAAKRSFDEMAASD